MTLGKETRSFPILREDLIKHFVRGLLDADGSVLLRSGHIIAVDFAGYPVLMDSIYNYLQNANIRFTEKCMATRGKIKILRITGRDNFKVLYGLLYSDMTICLERKRIRFLQ